MAAPSVCLLMGLSEFVIERVAAMLDAKSIVLLSKSAQMLNKQLQSLDFIRWVARLRQEQLHIDPAQVGTLEHLYIGSQAPGHWLIHFGFASLQVPSLPEESACKVADAAALLKRHPDLKVQVDGHTQPGALEPMATKLSQLRAELVARSIVMHGVDQSQILVDWHSSRKPLDNIGIGDDFAEASLNRRVEMTMLYDGIRATDNGEPENSEPEDDARAAERRKWRERPPSQQILMACVQLSPPNAVENFLGNSRVVNPVYPPPGAMFGNFFGESESDSAMSSDGHAQQGSEEEGGGAAARQRSTEEDEDEEEDAVDDDNVEEEEEESEEESGEEEEEEEESQKEEVEVDDVDEEEDLSVGGAEEDEDEEEDDMRWTDIVILLVGAIAAILLLVCYSPSIELDAAWLSEDAGGWGEDKVRLGRAGRRGFKLEGRLGKIGNMWGFGSWRRKGSAKHHDIDEL